MIDTQPVVFFFSLWIAFSWAVLYLSFSAIPLVFTKNHNFNIQENGAVFAGKQDYLTKPTTSNKSSYVRWLDSINYPQYLPGKGRQTLRQLVINSRRTTLFRLHRECLAPNRFVLVWMDVFPGDPLDRSHHCHYLCHDGDFLNLSCRLQLPCGHLSSLRKLGVGSTVFLSEHARRDFSLSDNRNVQSFDICWGFELPWRRGSNTNSRALDSGLLWT